MADPLTIMILKGYSKAQCVKLYFSGNKREAALTLDTCIKNGYLHFFLWNNTRHMKWLCFWSVVVCNRERVVLSYSTSFNITFSFCIFS